MDPERSFLPEYMLFRKTWAVEPRLIIRSISWGPWKRRKISPGGRGQGGGAVVSAFLDGLDGCVRDGELRRLFGNRNGVKSRESEEAKTGER